MQAQIAQPSMFMLVQLDKGRADIFISVRTYNMFAALEWKSEMGNHLMYVITVYTRV